MTNRFAAGASAKACRRRATRSGPSVTVSTATSASAAAALDPPQWLGTPHRRFARRRSEDHAARRRLQHRGDDHADRLIDIAPAVLDHDHGAVIEVGNPLVLLLPLLDALHVHLLAGDDDRLERVGEIVEVEDADPFELRDAIEVVVVRHDREAPLLRQLDQLHVDLVELGDVVVDEFDVDERLFLQGVQDLEAPPPAVAAQRIAGVGDVLQLGENEVGYQHSFTEEAGLRDVHDAAVDDDAGIQQHARVLSPTFDQSAGTRRPEDERHHLVAAVEAEGDAPVGEDQRDNQRDDEAEVPRQLGQKQADQRRQQQPDQQSHGRRYQVWQRGDV